MSEPVIFSLNRASAAQIARHLSLCDDGFVPPLSGRVDINAYALKITEKAVRFEAWTGGALVGLVATYCNDNERRAAYVTSVSVLPDWQGRRIASQLTAQCIAYAKGLGFERLELEVDTGNTSAIGLYRRMGFVGSESTGGASIMRLPLEKEA